MLKGKRVYVEFDEVSGFRGYYGRLLAYVYLENGIDFNEMLIKMGYARVYTEGRCMKEEEYLNSQNEAMNRKIGLWTCGNITSQVIILNVLYDAPGNDNYNLNYEYVVLKNVGSEPVNLKGWILRDEAGHEYVFPDFILEPGATVKVHTGSGVNTETDLYWGSNRAIWNNDHDTAYLYDAEGNLVDVYSW